MTTKLDLHCHTKGSDGSGTPKQFVQGIRKARLDGVVITDHHRTVTQEGLEIARATRAAGLLAFIGCEYSTREGHCLVYGVNIAELGFQRYPSMQEVLDKVHAAGGVAFPSHPYRGQKETLGDRIFQLKRLTHCEARNGQNEAGGFASTATPESNLKAIAAAEHMGLGQTGGSDAHQPDRLGECYTEFAGSIKTTADLVRALRAKDHVACVNEDLVTKRRQQWKSTHSVQRGWISGMAGTSTSRSMDANMPWWMDDEDDQLRDMDRASRRLYGQGDEADSSDAVEPSIDDPGAVQRFLNLAFGPELGSKRDTRRSGRKPTPRGRGRRS